MSKTAASRHWIEAKAAKIAELSERDLRQTTFFGLMLDGVALGGDAVVAIALGLTAAGKKIVLDFEVGASENAVVSTALVARLQRRGFGQPRGGRRRTHHPALAQRPGHLARLAPVDQRDRERHAQLPRPDRQGRPVAARDQPDLPLDRHRPLLHAKLGFHRIKGHADLPKLIAALALPSLTSGGGGGSAPPHLPEFYYSCSNHQSLKPILTPPSIRHF